MILPSRALPPRGGSRPINHSLTCFNHVRIPPTALLGSIKKPRDPRASFFSAIYRVAVGTIALSSLGVPSLQVASYIAARYSLRRHVVDMSGISKPIMSFQTQKQPILIAVAQAFVLEAMHKQAVEWFMDPALDPRVRHAVATVHKVAMIQAAQAANFVLGDRCGAQGLFEANQLSAMHVCSLSSSQLCVVYATPSPSLTCVELPLPRVTCWASLSVGIRSVHLTVLMLHLRPAGLASELLLGRYALEPPRYPDCHLAQHEKGLFSELRASLAATTSHRSETYNREVLPRSLPLIQAIGHRIAYEAARSAQIDGPLLDLFEAASMLQDEAWYVERLGMTRAELWEREARALEAVFPRLAEYLARMDVASYVVAPIVSDEKWKQFVSSLQVFGETSRGWGAGILGPLLDCNVSPTQLQVASRGRVRTML